MFGPLRQAQIFLDGVSGRRPTVPVLPEELERRALAAMRSEAAAYIAGGAGSERTTAANRRAFESWRIVPRVLRNVESREMRATLFGRILPSPLLMAPIGVLELAQRDADLAVARAAEAEGVPMVFSNQASVPMEQCAAVMRTTPHFFQLYWSRSDAVVRSFVSRAEQSGSSGIVLTLDTTMLGWRPRDLDLGYLPFMRGMGIAQYISDPVFRAELEAEADAARGMHAAEGTTSSPPRITLQSLRVLRELLMRTPGPLVPKLRTGWPRDAVRRFTATYSRPTLEWSDLARLREMTRLPILLKGILHGEDARMAVEHGVDGVIVSNHGGRQIDGEIAALDALPDVARIIDRRMPVLFDSGVRSGADVFKAIALGASAVLIGRPYVYGLALAGERGVREVLRNVRAEFDLTMGLAGCRTVSEIDVEMLRRA